MSELFLSIVNMSISASWIVLAVLLLRLPLKKAPKWIAVLLWAVVALRLVCPVTVESVLSLIPSPQTVPSAIMTDTVPQIYSGSTTMNHIVNPILSDVFSPNPGDSVNPLQIWIPVASAVWSIGILGFFAYGTLSYIRLRRKLCTAVRLRDNIYQSECVASPFVLGVLRPKIYLPFSLKNEELSHVIAHEEAHLHRKDHWWKPLGFAILTLHWFNPLVWLAYVLLCRDIELACDEKVVKDLSLEERADYSQALLHCSVGRKMIAFCPLAFGEVGVKDRIKSVLSYKKPAFWIILVALILSSVLAVCFLTNPRSGSLGTLENLEFHSLNTEDTSCVWVSDGFSYERVGPISGDLMRDLANIKTSKEEISANRSEDRDKSHTIVLQSPRQATLSEKSYLEGTYIHFNSDFTFVWINNGVKPTLSYKVMEPERAKEVYELIAGYNISEPAVKIPPVSQNVVDMETLKAKYPMYFGLETMKGLEVYIWQMAENSYSCGLLPGVNRNYSQEEIWDLHLNSTTLGEMQNIIAYYIASGEVGKESVSLHAITMPHSSYTYVIDSAYIKQLTELFWTKTFVNVIDDATFDIDADGKTEYCVLHYGPTSGLFTFTFSAYESGVLEYFNVFYTQHTNLRFAIQTLSSKPEGQLILTGEGLNSTYALTPTVKDGNIVLSSDEMEVQYWGEQGIDSPFATQYKGSLWPATFYSITSNEPYTDVIDEATFDIDHDGRKEYCRLETFSLYSSFVFSFSVCEDGEPEYFNIFTANHGNLQFVTNDDGQTVLFQSGGLDGDRYLSISVEQGNIIIYSDEQDVCYWGEDQGVDSHYAGLIFRKFLPNFFDSGPAKTVYGNLKTYYQNTDGTWQCEGYQYKYRLEITGRQPLAETDTTYVYLSNLESIPFEQAMWASGLSSSLTQYFSYEEAMLVEILTVPTAENAVFKKAENGNLISPSGVEYRFLANEGILNYIGELEYVGDVEGQSSDPTSPYKTGIFALKGNDNVLIRWREDSEWYAIYRKASLPPFQFTIDNCTRLEFLHYSEYFHNSKDHIACNRGIVGQTEAREFLFKVRLFEAPRDAGLYDLVRKPNGFLENCYLYGWLCGFFEEDPNLVVKMQVQSFNDLAYSIEIDRNEHVLANEFLQYLQSVSCPSELYTNEAPTECQANVQIFQNDDRTYSYTVSDLKGNILYRQENAVRKPKVWEVSSNVFGLVTQAGTGLSTNWAVFCDVERGRVSEPFYYVLGAQGDYVVYAEYKEDKHLVVVQNMFDKSAYCKTYELENVSPVAADFVVECEFDGDGNATVTYLVGKKYTRTKLTINIP